MSWFSDTFYKVTNYMDITNCNDGIHKDLTNLDPTNRNSWIYKNREAATAAALALGFPTLAAAIEAGAIIAEYINDSLTAP